SSLSLPDKQSTQPFQIGEEVSIKSTQVSHLAKKPIASFSAADFRSCTIKGIVDAKSSFNSFINNNAEKKKNKIDQETAELISKNAKKDFDDLNELIQKNRFQEAETHWRTMQTTKATAFQEATGITTYQRALDQIIL